MKRVNLTQGKVAIVDDEDFDRVKHLKYRLSNFGYALREGRQGEKLNIFLHHDILGFPPDGQMIDHINRNKLDNRKSNLRIVTRSQNGANRNKNSKRGDCRCTSRYKGVWREKTRWKSGIRVNGKLIHLGYFATEREAALEYNNAAIEYFGKFANLNEFTEV